MRIPPTGYLTLALLCGELVCVIVWALPHTRRRHRRRHWFSSSRDALGGLEEWV
jgi:hypothetical protein